jgi:hypothetical protein
MTIRYYKFEYTARFWMRSATCSPILLGRLRQQIFGRRYGVPGGRNQHGLDCETFDSKKNNEAIYLRPHSFLNKFTVTNLIEVSVNRKQ